MNRHPTKTFARRLLNVASKQGLYAYAVDHEGEEREELSHKTTEEKVRDITACDLETVYFRDFDGNYRGHVLLVLENWESGDILADHTDSPEFEALARAVEGHK